MAKNAGWANLVPQVKGWQNQPTVAIRIPEVFRDRALDTIRGWDMGVDLQAPAAGSLSLAGMGLDQLLSLQDELKEAIAAARAAARDGTIETAILRLANRCDRAFDQDGMGFSAADTDFGHWLATEIQSGRGLTPANAQHALKMIQKYAKTQLSDLKLPEWEAVKDQFKPAPIEPAIAEDPERIQLTANRVKVFAPYDVTGKFQRDAKAIEGFKFQKDSTGAWWEYPLAALPQVLEVWPEFTRISAHLFPGVLLHLAQVEAEKQAEKEAKAAEKAIAIARYTKALDLDQPLPNGWELMDHQKLAVEWLLQRCGSEGLLFGGILADDMGLGKTLSALVAAKALLEVERDLAIFVISPVSVRGDWLKLARAIEVPIECFSWARIPQPLESQRYVVIADEAHYAQDPKSQRTKALKALAQAKNCFTVWPLTGTPMKNGYPLNQLALLEVIRHPVAASDRAYKNRYCLGSSNSFGVDYSKGASHLDELNKAIANGVLRRKKTECLDLPPKTRIERIAELSSSAEKAWKAEIAAKIEDYRQKVETGELKPGADAIVTLNTLRNVGSRYKAETAIAMAQELLEQDQQVVIFTEFVDSAKMIHEALGGELLTGETSEKDREALKDRFQGGESKVFVGTIRAGGVGITLTAASHVILVDRPWTPADCDQAEDRVNRIGQQWPVTAWWVCLGEIDRIMADAIYRKAAIIEAVLGGKRKTLRGNVSIKELAQQILDAL